MPSLAIRDASVLRGQLGAGHDHLHRDTVGVRRQPGSVSYATADGLASDGGRGTTCEEINVARPFHPRGLRSRTIA